MATVTGYLFNHFAHLAVAYQSYLHINKILLVFIDSGCKGTNSFPKFSADKVEIFKKNVNYTSVPKDLG